MTLRAIHPLSAGDVAQNVVRGQYAAGTIDDKPVAGYRDEPTVSRKLPSKTLVSGPVSVSWTCSWSPPP